MNNPFDEFRKLHKFYAGGYDYQTKELAEHLGVTTRTIQRWLIGKTHPSESQMKHIQAYLNGKKDSLKDLES